MAPITKLSADVLSEIFLQVAIDGYHDVAPSPSFTVPVPSIQRPESRVYGYIALSHVCREWRRVALGTPGLWARMVFPCKHASEELFARSGQAPLWITAELDRSGHPTPHAELELSLIKANSSRLRQLHLAGSPLGIEDYLSTWTSRVDAMEDLALLGSGPYDTVRQRGSLPKYPPLFSQSLRNIRRLVIQNIPFSWDCSLLSSSLTTLATCTYAGSASITGSAEGLLSALGSMSGLQFLELSETVPRVLGGDSTAAQHVMPIVSLPRLRLLVLKSRVNECAWLLRHISFPPETRLVLTAHTERDGDIPRLMDAIDDLTTRVAWSPILSLLLPAHSMGQMRVCGWRSTVEPDSNLPSDLDIILSEFRCGEVIREVLDGPVFSQVQRARTDRMDPDSWEVFIRHLPELQELSMRDAEFLDLLILAGHSSTQLPAPKLSVLKLLRFRFGCIHDEHEDRGYDQLCNTLQYRRQRGVPITRLELSDCENAYSGSVEALRKIVPTVVWDGKENLEDEEDDPEESCEDRTPLDDGYDEELAYAAFEDPNIFDGMSSEDAYAMIPW
ncbi:hypothetical protein OH76DRAFT_1402184 [Lentinus brumalis]|uniref:Uncharacterized protein n=1 Tax=Lentinus brumalis TaxID=2498619 RepID=A0A371DEH5_9APHY|nr:hypothetical protein OH76DRAFT_1402184 [Polyporus brumalis]